MIELKIDKFVWVLACSICTIITAFLFVPSLASFYLFFGRYFIYLAFFTGLVAIALIWYRSYKLRGWRNQNGRVRNCILYDLCNFNCYT